jgi:hypothetical protein
MQSTESDRHEYVLKEDCTKSRSSTLNIQQLLLFSSRFGCNGPESKDETLTADNRKSTTLLLIPASLMKGTGLQHLFDQCLSLV